MNLRYSLLSLLLFISAFAVNADMTNDGMINFPRLGKDLVSLPSPEASALCQHVDHAIDYSTGRMSIVYPLFTYSAGDIEQTISMRYQTGGLKADEEPGALGLGWELDYGGFVVRSVVGKPDDRVTHFSSFAESNPTLNYLKETYQGNYDASSDIYTYRADGTLVQRIKAEPARQAPHFAPHLPGITPPGVPTAFEKTYEDFTGPLTFRNRALSRIDTPYGFISDGDVYFYITDYQGNVREVTDIDGEVVQDAHYYPYGMLMAESSDILDVNRSSLSSLSVLNPYLFGCKEYIPFKGANYLDFTARHYDPARVSRKHLHQKTLIKSL